MLRIEHFEWDKWNIEKNIVKHAVSPEEVEEAVFDEKAKLKKTRYGRFILFGRTEAGRYLIVVFLIKDKNTIRAISFREMTKNERRFYNG